MHITNLCLLKPLFMHLINTEHLHIPDSGSMHGDKDPKVSKADKVPPGDFIPERK